MLAQRRYLPAAPPHAGAGDAEGPLQTLIQGREPEVVFAVLSNFLVLAQRYPMLFSQVGDWQLRPIACWFGGDGSCLLLWVSRVSDAWRGCAVPWHASARASHRGGSRPAACAGMQVPCL